MPAVSRKRIALFRFRTLSSKGMETSGAAGLLFTKHEFLEHVVGLAPRVAAFDCDGTLWSGDAGESFFQWEIKQRIVTAEVGHAMLARHAEYRVSARSAKTIRAAKWSPCTREYPKQS